MAYACCADTASNFCDTWISAVPGRIAVSGRSSNELSHLDRGDLLAAAVDELLDAARERQEAVAIQEALVAGVEPAACKFRSYVCLINRVVSINRRHGLEPRCGSPGRQCGASRLHKQDSVKQNRLTRVLTPRLSRLRRRWQYSTITEAPSLVQQLLLSSLVTCSWTTRSAGWVQEGDQCADRAA